MDLSFILGFLRIVVIDLALSGDNAIVIGMAAASLPRDQRLKAIIIGGACAIGLRIVLTAAAAWLMDIPLISAIAGAVLFWVAWKLLRMNVEEEEAEEAEEAGKAKKANNFRKAIVLILTADFMMSLDNVLAVAGTAQTSATGAMEYVLLIAGLLISMPLLMTTGGVISRLIDKFRWLPFLGAAVVCFTGMHMILGEKKFIEPALGLSPALIIIISVLVGILFPLALILINRIKAKKMLARRNAEPAVMGGTLADASDEPKTEN
jgi:YjbE family integral membrane protein